MNQKSLLFHPFKSITNMNLKTYQEKKKINASEKSFTDYNVSFETKTEFLKPQKNLQLKNSTKEFLKNTKTTKKSKNSNKSLRKLPNDENSPEINKLQIPKKLGDLETKKKSKFSKLFEIQKKKRNSIVFNEDLLNSSQQQFYKMKYCFQRSFHIQKSQIISTSESEYELGSFTRERTITLFHK